MNHQHLSCPPVTIRYLEKVWDTHTEKILLCKYLKLDIGQISSLYYMMVLHSNKWF
jgi:hypothetical protein